MVRQQRATQSRDAIVRAAAHVIDRYGLKAATISKVSAEAGLSKGAVYFHFADKDALADALESEAARALDELAALCTGDNRPALTAMVETTRELAILLSRDVVIRAGFQVSCDRAEGGVPVLRQRLTAFLLGLLEDARRDGSLAPSVAVEDVVTAILAVTVGVQVLSRQPDTATEISGILDRFWHAMLPQLIH
ncbi:ScbR family autoregulator-binding transcription factor [Streptomyces longwoodensis]|uniref:ScbR family autoregulator-binding transcription factor n=1 Tax=Streptomyces longwoodensis TaxID=68231 RepID=UPI00225806F6|nr:ScbR family autoregulator-binding transcription factor [Streptomyces longwoodensis]MCX5000557.1 ScbR family autoregulator-binding transcription factor [Streptomyces longwoodensis]